MSASCKPSRLQFSHKPLHLESLEPRQMLSASTPELLFADSFEQSEWNGLWVEDSQNDWLRSRQRATAGVYSAEVDGKASNASLTMANPVDLTPYETVSLSFSWLIESSFDKNEYVAVDVFDGAWREVATLRGNVDAENVWHHRSIEIDAASLVANFKVRFRATASDSDEDANVDDVKLIGIRPTPMLSVSDAQVVEGDATLRFVDAFVPTDGSGLLSARHVAVGPDGQLYVASQSSHEVKAFDPVSGRLTKNISDPGMVRPWALTFGPDGRLYVSGIETDNIYRYDLSTGTYQLFVDTASGGLTNNKGLTFGPDGNLYATSSRTSDRPGEALNSVLRYDGQTGAFIDVFVETGSGGLDNPNGLVFGPNGNLYVSSTFTDSVNVYNGATGDFLSVFIATGAGGLDGPDVLEFRDDGLLYIASQFSREILRFDALTGGFVDSFIPIGPEGAQIDQLVGFAFGTQGELYVSSGTDFGKPGSSVLRYAPANLPAFTISLSQAGAAPVTVGFATHSGTATAGVDFEAVSGTVIFAPGETQRIILVPIIDDAFAEPEESFSLKLSGATGADIADAEGLGTIFDDDALAAAFAGMA